MPIITLPDGNNLTFPDKVTGLDVAEKISKSLAKQAMVISVDGDLKDLDFLIEKDCSSSLQRRRTYVSSICKVIWFIVSDIIAHDISSILAD